MVRKVGHTGQRAICQAKEYRLDSPASISGKARSSWTPVHSLLLFSRTGTNHKGCNRAIATSFHSCPNTQTPGWGPQLCHEEIQIPALLAGLLLLEERVQKGSDAKM